MSNLLRNTGACIAGFLIGNVLIFAIEQLNSGLLPSDLKPGDMDAFRAAIAKLPTRAFIVVLLAWTTGSFGGPFTTALLARGPRTILACVIGGWFWIATLSMLILIPGPFFMWLGLLIVPIMTIAGARLGIRLNPNPPAGPQPYDMRKKGMACK